MSNSKKLAAALEARQGTENIIVEITQAQLAASLVANGGDGYVEFDVPENGVLVLGSADVNTAFDGTTATISIGDAGSATRYGGGAINLKSEARTAFTPDGYVYGASGNERKMRLTYAYTGSPTEVGNLLLHLQFCQIGKSAYTRGNASAPSVAPNPGPNT
jgi:hypothetical protein